ncbi:MAG: thiamine-phosphate kinase [Candidatus Aenigmarchaeota archaeon]|nr:thiamine-phosphate kinase [Candidatus Aenigmarchaeota archaeon]
MNLSQAGERKIIEKIRGIVRRDPGMLADLEDDAAIFELDAGKYAVTTDMGHAETHFLTDDPAKIGKKIVTSNATDLLAKGAVPKYMLISIGMPESYPLGFVEKLYEAMDSELKKYGAHIIGGDTNKSGGFVYSVTMIGKVMRPLPRNGAKAGDLVVLTGQIGNSAAGYIALKRKIEAEPDFIDAQLEPEIDIGLCRKIIESANCGIDISDGLAFELNEIARLSGKLIEVSWEKLPVHPKMRDFCMKNDLDIRDIVLHHGEDYQIAYTTPKKSDGIVIGEVREGSGVYLLKEGKREKLEQRGYEHFKSN